MQPQVLTCLLFSTALVPASAQLDIFDLKYSLNSSTTDNPDLSTTEQSTTELSTAELSSTEQSTTEWNTPVHVDISKTEISVIELRRACDGWQMADVFVELIVADSLYETSVDNDCGDNFINCEWTDVFSIDSAVDRMTLRVFEFEEDKNQQLGYRRLSLYSLIEANDLSVDTDDTYTMEIDMWDTAYDCSMRLEFSVCYYGVEKEDGGGNGSGGLSDWAIFGIVVGCVALFYVLRRTRKKALDVHSKVHRRKRQDKDYDEKNLIVTELLLYCIARALTKIGCGEECECGQICGGVCYYCEPLEGCCEALDCDCDGDCDGGGDCVIM